MPAYWVVTDQTAKTIDSRVRYFRNVAVAVVVLTLGSIGGAQFLGVCNFVYTCLSFRLHNGIPISLEVKSWQNILLLIPHLSFFRLSPKKWHTACAYLRAEVL